MDTTTVIQYLPTNSMIDSAVIPAIVSAFTSMVMLLLGAGIWWFKRKFDRGQEVKKEKTEREKLVFERMLDNHSRQFANVYVNQNRTEHEFEHNLMVSKDLLVWSSDEVLFEYGEYMTEEKLLAELTDREKHFAKSILAFRKQIGYKNIGLTPEKVAIVFKAGWRRGEI